MVTIQKTNSDRAFEQAKSKAKKLEKPIIYSSVLEVDYINPVAFYHAGYELFQGERFFWKDRDHTHTIVGLGTAFHIRNEEVSGRFLSVEQKWKRLIADAEISGVQQVMGTGPLLFGGFSFDPLKKRKEEWSHFSHATFQLPSLMVTHVNDKTYVTMNVICTPKDEGEALENLIKQRDIILNQLHSDHHSDEPQIVDLEEIRPEEWKQSVQHVVEDLQAGLMEKVVLARSLKVEFKEEVSSDPLLKNLSEQQPNSYLFSMELMNSCFIGASPERLVKKAGEMILSTCLAGSIGRGSSPKEDEQLGQELLHDSKNLHEHRLVVDSIKEALEPYCETIEMPGQPQLLKVRDIQHLYTPVTGIASVHTSLLSIVENLHPTPALGGVPQQKAVRKIREIEEMDRGLYAAPIGWFDSFGNGEFAVAIRSGLLTQKHMYLYAGCGIVADSNPESEYTETQIKFRPMLRAIGGRTNATQS